MSLIAGLAAAVRAGLRPIVLCGLAGLILGLTWGLADEPVYTASATVIVTDRGDAADAVGNGVVGGGDPASTARLLGSRARARSRSSRLRASAATSAAPTCWREPRSCRGPTAPP